MTPVRINLRQIKPIIFEQIKEIMDRERMITIYKLWLDEKGISYVVEYNNDGPSIIFPNPEDAILFRLTFGL